MGRRTWILAGCVAWIALACAAPRVHGPSTVVEPTGAEEVCLDLRATDQVRYAFDAGSPVDFDVHFHGDGPETYLIQEGHVYDGDGVFLPEGPQRYCFVWKNTSPTAISLTYKLSIEDRGE